MSTKCDNISRRLRIKDIAVLDALVRTIRLTEDQAQSGNGSWKVDINTYCNLKLYFNTDDNWFFSYLRNNSWQVWFVSLHGRKHLKTLYVTIWKVKKKLKINFNFLFNVFAIPIECLFIFFIQLFHMEGSLPRNLVSQITSSLGAPSSLNAG